MFTCKDVVMPFVCDKYVRVHVPIMCPPSPDVIYRCVFCALTYLKHGTPIVLSVFVRKRFFFFCLISLCVTLVEGNLIL